MPETYEIPHRDILAQCLATLGTDADQLLGYDVLAGGASGAYAYRLRFPSGNLLLKVTRPESPRYLLERARREILFYRHLASDVWVQVPSVIASRCGKAVGACLLLEAYEPAPEPAAWTETRYVQAAEQLGRFHAAFWGKGRELSTLGWLRRVEELEEADIRQAYTYWERLRAEGRFEAILTPERYTWVIGMLGRIRGVGTGLSSFPVTLCHGDFHIGNILVDRGGGMVLADWQEVGPGRGPEDLSFFLQRASFSGGTVPGGEMIDAYRRSLTANMDEDVPVSDIRCVMDAAELRTRLLHWPAFLAAASEHQMADLLDRIRVLAAGMETTPASGS
ncbi:MAG: aminoglycoside phosphotransferase family protein [Thermomicrobiales bacterium]